MPDSADTPISPNASSIPTTPIIIGHRGASGYRPEHTCASYELAFALGADAVEPDIVASRDGVLVLRHENNLSDTTDIAQRAEFADRRTEKEINGRRHEGWFTEDFTWAELSTLRARERLPHIRPGAAFDNQYPILRLRDLFEIVDRASEEQMRMLGLVAEIKHATYFENIGLPLHELFAAEAAEAGWVAGDRNLVIESFELTVLEKLSSISLPARYIYLLARDGTAPDAVLHDGANATSYAQQLTDAGLAELRGHVDGISVDVSLVLPTDERGRMLPTTDIVRRAHATGLMLYCWTLRPENIFLPTDLRRGDQDEEFGDWESAFAAVLATGIDGVFADHPDLVARVREHNE